MKTLLLTIALVLTSLVHAQDTTFLQSLNSLSEAEALQFSSKIGNNTYEILAHKESTKAPYMLVYLIKSNLTAAAKETAKSDLKNCDNCMRVVFYSYGNTPNKTYKFNKVSGTYDVLFPTWQKVFKPDATYQATLTETNLQRIENRTEKINFDFKKHNILWQLQNWN